MGGTHKPRQYRPPYIRLAPPGPRPRPRPAYTGATTTEGRETSGDTLLSSKRHRDESDDEDAKVEIPVKKRWIAKRQALVHTPEDDHTIGISNSPAPFRQGTQSRTAAKFQVICCFRMCIGLPSISHQHLSQIVCSIHYSTCMFAFSRTTVHQYFIRV